MKNFMKATLFAGAMFSLVMTGCDKAKDVLPDDTNPTNTSSPSIIMGDGHGVLAAVRSVSYTTVAGVTVPLEVNTAVAAFNVSAGSSSFADGGAVTLNGKGLAKSSNNAYSYQNLTDPLTFSSVSWNVAGSSSVPAFSYSDDRAFPDYSGFSSLPATVTRSSGVTISLGSMVSNADSVYVILTDYNNHSILKRLGGNASSCTFSAAELGGFTAGQGMVQVTPWNYKAEDFSSKKFYFVLESAYTKQGITIN